MVTQVMALRTTKVQMKKIWSLDEEEEREILEPISEGSPTLNAGGFSPTSEDVDMTGAPESINFDTTEHQNVSCRHYIVRFLLT